MLNTKRTEGITLEGSLYEKAFSLLEATGLNWTVNKQPLQTADGKTTESYGMFKSDNSWLGTVGKQYNPYQNHELAETIIQASEGLGHYFRGGLINKGEKVFLQLQLKDEIIGTDTVKRYVTALSSHDGSSSVGFGSSNTVVICQNIFYRAYRQLSKVKRGYGVKQNVEIVAKKLMETMLKHFGKMFCWMKNGRIVLNLLTSCRNLSSALSLLISTIITLQSVRRMTQSHFTPAMSSARAVPPNFASATVRTARSSCCQDIGFGFFSMGWIVLLHISRNHQTGADCSSLQDPRSAAGVRSRSELGDRKS